MCVTQTLCIEIRKKRPRTSVDPKLHRDAICEIPPPHLYAKTRPRPKGLDPDLAGDVPGPAPAESVSVTLHHHGADSLGCVEVQRVDDDDRTLLLIHHH